MSQITDVKAEVQELIAQESDVDILQAIKTILQKKQPDIAWRERFVQRAEKAEEDIQRNRLRR
ncbi:hypothetical protein [Tunicatimonas pelagia]|uniref:hypothetical protein n=1 Tax=Tunicatimonas pelagia TaxID=931531 RepID=UPI0026662224|nr:hypothetical protein [Tunicatimonas pelagia]WKN41840.1 hypothetical protein P0M28_22635 [Tunicatimonas pelagia]